MNRNTLICIITASFMTLLCMYLNACSECETCTSAKDCVNLNGDADRNEIEEETACLDPWLISSVPWAPQNSYNDAAYRQEQSFFVEDELPGVVNGILPTGDDSVLVATIDGLFVVEGAPNGDEPINVYPLPAWPQVSEFSAVFETGTGLIGAVCGDELYIGEMDGLPGQTQLSDTISKVVPDGGGALWLILGESELVQFDADLLQVIKSFGPFTEFEINDLCENGDQLVLSTDAGVWKINTSDGQLTLLIDGNDLPSTEVNGALCSDDGGLWLATGNGLVSWNSEKDAPFIREDGMPYYDARGVSRTLEGKLLLPSGRGLMTYIPETGTWDYYHSRYWIPDWDVRSVAATDGGSLYVGTSTGLGIIYGEMMTLAEKAAVLDDGMYTRHNRLGYFSRCSLAEPGDLSQPVTHDDDNDGQWTGMYLAAQCFRYVATGDQEAKDIAIEAANALLRLLEVTGKDGFFARSVVEPELCPAKQEGPGEWHLSDDEAWCWKGDTSSDEYVGHIFGLSLYYDLIDDETEKRKVRDAFVRLHDGIIANGYILEDIDGYPTEHGHFEPAFIQGIGQYGDAGLNSAMILGGLRATYHMSGEERFQEAFEHLAIDENYAEYVSRIEQINITVRVNHDSEEMSSLALATLIRYETDECFMAQWQDGLRYFWEVQRPERNPEFNFIYAWLSRSEENDLENSIRTLKEMSLHGIRWQVTNSHRMDYSLDPKLDRHGVAQALEPFPYDQKGYMRWAENPYQLDDPGNGRSERMLQPWLLPYWLGRYIGLIVAE